MSREVYEALERANALFEEFRESAELVTLVQELPPVAKEPVRTASYPLGIVLDKRAVHALVG